MFVSGADGLVTIVQGRGAFSDFEKSDFRIFLRSGTRDDFAASGE
jgi:hypothetical protein